MVWSDAHATLPARSLMRLDSMISSQPPRPIDGPRRSALSFVAHPLTVVIAAAILAIVPAWNPVWYQDDQLPTLFRILHTSLAHQWGIPYPRLAPELGFGYGRLLHEFYPPFGVETAAWVHALGTGYIDAARVTFSLCLLGSALGMFAYAKAVLDGPWPAALAAIAYVWSPYVLLDAHKGGVLGESVALALMPWAQLAMHRLAVRRSARWIAATAGSMALVVLGHNITALFFVGLATIYGVIVAVAERRADLRRTIVAVIGSVLLALALAAIYWLPALLELPYSRVSDQSKGDFNVVRNLVDAGALFQPSLLFDYYIEAVPRFGLVAGLLTIGAIVLVVAGAVMQARRMRAQASSAQTMMLAVLGAFAVCFVVVMLLQLRDTALIWQTIPLISFVQFPQRLFVFGSFAGAVVLGGVPWAIRSLGVPARPSLLIGACAVLAIGATSVPGLFWTWPVAASHVIDEDQVGIATAAERRLAERSAFDDYFPIWVEEDSSQILRPASPSRADAYAAANAGPVPHLHILERGYLSMKLESDADAPSTLVLHTFYFPGWFATADGARVPVDPSGPLGLVRVQVPAGKHVVEVWFGETQLRITATFVSAVGLAVVLLLLVRSFGALPTLVGLTVVLALAFGPWAVRRAIDPGTRPAAQVVDADVSPAARLVAVEPGPASAARGDTVTLTLLWQATTYSGQDLQSGVRLVPADGDQVVSERWARPDRERSPTSKWIVGEVVPDTIQLRIPLNAPPGSYRLLAGLRDGDAPNRGAAYMVPIGTLAVR
jgi:hypothetical protein